MLREYECELVERLWREQAGIMRAYVIARTGSATEAEDVVGEVYWRACRALAGGLRPNRNPKGWIWQILHNYRIDLARQVARRRLRMQVQGRVCCALPIAESTQTGYSSTTHGGTTCGCTTHRLGTVAPPDPITIETRARVQAALGKLPPRQAALMILRHYRGYTLAEIALCFGITYGAAKAIHHRAARRLRAIMEDWMVS